MQYRAALRAAMLPGEARVLAMPVECSSPSDVHGDAGQHLDAATATSATGPRWMTLLCAVPPKRSQPTQPSRAKRHNARCGGFLSGY